tara:strand:+ start:601 stop:1476 length:876 start_codon:yes stop_codon:yes gene_type:complete
MMLRKTVFVPITRRDQNENALLFGLWLARVFHGHMDAVYIQSHDIDIPFDIDASMAEKILAEADEKSAEAAKSARENFDAQLRDAGISYQSEASSNNSASASWKQVKGDEQEVIAQKGCLYDLVVANRPNQGCEPFGGALVKSAIFNTHRPILVTPPCFKDVYCDTQIENWNVLVGWNSTVYAANAIANAMPLLERVKSVELLNVQTGAKKGASVQEAAYQLRLRGIEVSVKEVAPDSRSVGQILLAEAMEFGASLLIMGAYSHNRMKEFVLGGVTRHILDQAEIPVLMSH